MSDPCAWPVDMACFGAEWDQMPQDVQDRAVALASATLHRLSGYRVSNCPITVRPCKASCADASVPSYFGVIGAYGPFRPGITADGSWVNSCGCTTDCSCETLCSVALPGPVGRVDEVKVDGQAVDAADYVLIDNAVVWAGTGECPWPTCQSLTLPDTEPGTFSITYLNAYPVDALAQYAAGVLALEFARACTDSRACRLPAGVTSISRQGISIDIEGGAFPGGFTGIREVDTWIALWNPNGLRQAPSVWFPGKRTPKVVR